MSQEQCNMEKVSYQKVYAVKHKNLEVRLESRSGGIFTALSDYVILQGGVVYGCILSDDFSVIHYRADNYASRDLMRGSKYVQSDMGNIFSSVKNDLEKGALVLFSGTSCQVGGLKAFLNKEYINLLCMDIVCHGVPSPKVWRDSVEWIENKYKNKCIDVDFRNKKDFGWIGHIETYTLKNGKKVNSEVYKNLYFKHLILRPSCFKCPYKDVNHSADITVADYWGIDKAAPGFSDNKGVSLVLINDIKAEEIFMKISSKVDYCVCDIKDSMQPALIKPVDRSQNREKFWEDYNHLSFEDVAKKYGNYNWILTYKYMYKKIRYKFAQIFNI